MLVMLLAAAAVYGVGNSTAFGYRTLVVEGASITGSTAIEDAIHLTRGTNLFRLATGPLEDAIGELPTVTGAEISVKLPDTLEVRVKERAAILVWRVGERRYLADAEGHLFAKLGDDPPPDAAALPVVEDRRAASAGLSIGSTLDRVDLDAATRLASLVPGDVGSQGRSLEVIVNDASGFAVVGRPAGWRAVFGFYTPSLRTPELIPGQVRLLRSLLVGREATVDRVILASETDGTYTSRPTPKPTATPKPSAKPSPTTVP
jgi:hypothetical protein